MTWKAVNRRGKPASKGLEPADLKQCQANPNLLTWSFMSFGPRPKPIRCYREPEVVVVQNRRGDDGKIGSMSLCFSCLVHYIAHFPEGHSKVNVIPRRGQQS